MLAVLPPLLSGCWDAKDVDNRLLVGAMGLETSGDLVNVWLRFPLPKTPGSSNQKNDHYTLSQKGITVIDAMNQARYKLQKSLDPSSTRAVLLSEGMAKQGIAPYLEFAIRERSVPLNVVTAIVRGDMKRIFEDPNPTGELSGIYTKLFFEPYAGGLPRKNRVRLWEIYSNLYSPFRENLIPLLQEGPQNSFELAGNAIFVEDRMKGTISKDESLVYEMVTRRFTESEVRVTHNKMDIKLLHNKSLVAAKFENGRPVITVDVFLTATLVDSMYNHKSNKDTIKSSLESTLEAQAKSLFKKTQQYGADIFGFGNNFRGRLATADYSKWRELYKTASITLRMHIDVRDTGLQILD